MRGKSYGRSTVGVRFTLADIGGSTELRVERDLAGTILGLGGSQDLTLARTLTVVIPKKCSANTREALLLSIERTFRNYERSSETGKRESTSSHKHSEPGTLPGSAALSGGFKHQTASTLLSVITEHRHLVGVNPKSRFLTLRVRTVERTAVGGIHLLLQVTLHLAGLRSPALALDVRQQASSVSAGPSQQTSRNILWRAAGQLCCQQSRLKFLSHSLRNICLTHHIKERIS
jgi:hypothetical protein